MTERSRCDKRCYETEQSARRKLTEIRSKRGHRAQRVEERAYHCDKCGWWHLTSKPLAYSSLDRVPDTDIRHPKRRVKAFHQKFDRPVRPLANISDYEDITLLASLILVRIRRYRAKSQRGSVLLVASDGEVYLVPEHETAFQRFVDRRPQWRVGSYAMRTPPVFPTLQDIVDDLACHLADLEISHV